jgi:hypothetical protein
MARRRAQRPRQGEALRDDLLAATKRDDALALYDKAITLSPRTPEPPREIIRKRSALMFKP